MNKTSIATGKSNSTAAFLQWLLFAVVAWLFGYVAYTSFGYDDEFFNIRMVRDNSFGEMVNTIQSTDIHPPLSYILNFLFFKVFHSWNMVRLCSALLFLCSLAYVVLNTKEQKSKWLIILLLGFNPTLLLWATSLRWYAYVVPLLLFVSVLPDYRNRFYWFRFFAVFFVVFFLGYIGFILFVPYFLYYWFSDKTEIRKKITRVLSAGVLFGALYAWQFYIFITVHSKSEVVNNANQQVFDLKANLVSLISSTLSNQGVFPLSVWGLVSIAGMGILLLSCVLYFREINKEKHWLSFALATVLFVIAGIAGKIRNLVLLEPARNLLIGSAVSVRKKKMAVIGLCLLLTGNVAGVYHVLMHRQTTKNAWNIPLQETMQQISLLEQPTAKEIYFTHSPTFAYYLIEGGKNTISFYSVGYFDSSSIHTHVADLENDSSVRSNFTFLLTYRGKSISGEHYKEMLRAMNGIKADSVKRIHIGLDKDHALKKKYFPDYPEYEVELVRFYGVKPPFRPLVEWEKAE